MSDSPHERRFGDLLRHDPPPVRGQSAALDVPAMTSAGCDERHSGVCGRAPPDHLVPAGEPAGWGIDVISPAPERAQRTPRAELEIGQAAGHAPRR